MSRKPDPNGVVDALRQQAEACLEQAQREKQLQTSEALKSLAKSYAKIAAAVEQRLQSGAWVLNS